MIGVILAGFFVFILFNLPLLGDIKSLYYRFLRRFKKTDDPSPGKNKTPAVLASDGEHVSVELALNSRCTSDHDGDPHIFHWGMFDKESSLSSKQIRDIAVLADSIRLTDNPTGIVAHDHMLTFTIDATASGTRKDQLMVESGMQQQAVCLACAVYGIGMVFRNMGIDGKKIDEKKHATIKIKLNAMKPSYNGSYWDSKAPGGLKSWKKGNLPDPVRDGNTPLVAALRNISMAKTNDIRINKNQIGQLLWAARGRTPHMYMSRYWGMTIPTWGGLQDNTAVHYLDGDHLYLYENWKNNRPTHHLSSIGASRIKELIKLDTFSSAHNGMILFNRNEMTGRALWEIGYQMLNLLVQAESLGIGYQTIFLDETEKNEIKKTGISDPVAAVCI